MDPGVVRVNAQSLDTVSFRDPAAPRPLIIETTELEPLIIEEKTCSSHTLVGFENDQKTSGEPTLMRMGFKNTVSMSKAPR